MVQGLFILLLWWAIAVGVWNAPRPSNENVRVAAAILVAWLGLASFLYLQSGDSATIRVALAAATAGAVTWVYWRLRNPVKVLSCSHSGQH